MFADLNLCIVDGVVESKNEIFQLKSSVPILRVTLVSKERFKRKNDPKVIEHSNFIPIEFLGTSAEKFSKELNVGSAYRFRGYLRTDNINGQQNVLRMRCVAVEAGVHGDE